MLPLIAAGAEGETFGRDRPPVRPAARRVHERTQRAREAPEARRRCGGGRAGALTGEAEVSGFDAFAGMDVRAARRRRTAKDGDDLAERRRQKREHERRRRALVKRLGQLEARAEAAEREANRARIGASEAEAAAAERRQEAEAAAAELEELSE